MNMQRRRAMAWLAAAGTGALATCAPVVAQAGAYEDWFRAIVRNLGDDITALLRRGFDPNTRDPKGEVGLTIALHLGSMSAFDAILAARNVKVEARNDKDESPLMMAALKGNLRAARALMAKDADVNKTGWTPLHYAASCTTSDGPAMITLLLENHAYIDAASPNGTTPLMMAVRYGLADSARLLLLEGADPTLKNQLGLTAVEFARQAQRQDMADLVAEAIRQRRTQGRSPSQQPSSPQPATGRW